MKGELGDDDEFAQLQGSGDHGLAELGQVVLVGTADLFDEAMQPEAFEQAGHLSASFVGEEPAQGFILHAADVELAACDGGEQGFVAGIEQVETGIGTAFVLDWLREPVELVTAVVRILDSGQEF